MKDFIIKLVMERNPEGKILDVSSSGVNKGWLMVVNVWTEDNNLCMRSLLSIGVDDDNDIWFETRPTDADADDDEYPELKKMDVGYLTEFYLARTCESLKIMFGVDSQ